MVNQDHREYILHFLKTNFFNQNLSAVKSINNSFKRTHGFKASVSLLYMLTVFDAPLLSKGEIGQDYLMKSTDKHIKPKIKQEVSDIDGNVLYDS